MVYNNGLLRRYFVERSWNQDKSNANVPLSYAVGAMAGALALSALRPFARYWVIPTALLSSLHGLEALRKSTPQ